MANDGRNGREITDRTDLVTNAFSKRKEHLTHQKGLVCTGKRAF